MFIRKRIKRRNKIIDALAMTLGNKNLIVIKGGNGYIMCGYLDLKAAEKAKDTAVKITGVSTIEQALRTRVCSCTSTAKKLGIYKGQTIKKVLGIIS